MPTHDYIIANGTGAAVRADINLALSAIVSLNSSASEPGTMYAYQLWADTAAGLLKIRNGANSAWVTLRQLDGDFSIVAVEDGSGATPSLTFTNDLNTGIFRPGNDSLAIVTGATRAITITSTQAVGIQTATPSQALHVAGIARVGADDATDAVLEIGAGASGNRTSFIDIVADTTYTDYGLRVIRNNTGANATSELKHRGTGALNFTTQEAAPIVFNTTNSSRLTITSGGLVGIGATPSAWSSFTVLQVKNSSVASTGNDLNLMANAYYDGSNYRRIAASAVGRQYFNTDGSIAWSQSGSGSADSTVTFSTPMTLDSSGRLGIGTTTVDEILRINGSSNSTARLRIQNQTTDVAFLGSHLGMSGTGNANDCMLSSASASNLVFGIGTAEKARLDTSGNVLVGTTSNDPAGTNVTGVAVRPDGFASGFSGEGGPACKFNRKANDGEVITIIQDGTQEGNISVSGTTVSYNGAHLSRWSQLASGAERTEILRGSILSNLDEMCEWGEEDNEQLNRMKVSTVEGDKNVSGVFQCWDDDDDTYINDFYCAMTGDFIIRIAEGVTIERGDLLMSAGDGTAKPQDDDIIRSKTIAKVTSTNVSCTYEDGSYCVPCVLMAC